MKDVSRLLAGLEARDAVVRITIGGLGEGWLRPEDADLPAQPVAPTVFMLHRADPLVRSHTSELKERYRGVEVLQYLLIDGALQGAVCGHWRIGPHDVEDIVVDLSPAERAGRKAEIMRAVAWGYHPPSHSILCYAGEPLVP